MAHLVEIVNGKAQMAYAGEKPWHRLGVEVPADLTPQQMLEAAGLDWTVEKYPLFANIGDERIPTSAEALVRSSDNKVLSIVTDSWNPVQNYEAFEFFNEFVQAGDMEMNTAGSLRGGRQVWALAKVKNSFFELFGGDRTEGFLLFSNPHQFGKAIDVRFTAIRVVCNNTLTLSLDAGSKNAVRLDHRTVFNPEKVKETLGIATGKLERYKEMAAFLGSKQYKKENIVEYFNRVFPLTTNKEVPADKPASRAARLAVNAVEAQPGAEFAEGSFWQLYNASTFVIDHKLGRSDDSRMSSAWFGYNKERKIKALNTAMEMAEAV
jgi:phage/plasmid-like protein (TIGR03299 family)